MTIRVGWVSPFTPLSGVGTFTKALIPFFNLAQGQEEFEFTILRAPTDQAFSTGHKVIRLVDSPEAADILDLFDVLIYSIGNNHEHHGLITKLMRRKPGIAILHDYVYQHFFARTCFEDASAASYGALMALYYGDEGMDVLEGSGISSSPARSSYSPWETAVSMKFPLSEPFIGLASGLVVHSQFAESYARPRFSGPVCRLFMPHDQKPGYAAEEWESWSRRVFESRPLRALSFGHLNATKHIDTVLIALASSELLRQGMHLTVAGHAGADYRSLLERTVKQHGLERNVTFEYSVSEEKLGELIRDADFFINLRLPNTEGASASLAEQMHIGKPSMVFPSGSYAEISPDACIRVDDPTAASVRRSLEAVANGREVLVEKGRRARQVSSQNDSKGYVERLKEFLVENYDLLRSRGNVAPDRVPADSFDTWTDSLVKARTNLLALQQGWLPCLTAMNIHKASLSRYFALVILGADASPSLVRRLDRLFHGLADLWLYRLCVLAYFVSSVVRDPGSTFQGRLDQLVPILDVNFWRIVVALPADLFEPWVRKGLGAEAPEGLNYPKEYGENLSRKQLLLEMMKSSGRLKGSQDGQVEDLLAWLSIDDWTSEVSEEELLAPILPLDKLFSFKIPSEDGPLLQGFYRPEPDGIWTNGTGSRLLFRVFKSSGTALKVTLRINPHGCEQMPGRVLILRDGLTEKETTTVLLQHQITECSITLREEAHSGLCILVIRVAEIFRPAQFGLPDSRDLGVSLREMLITRILEK